MAKGTRKQLHLCHPGALGFPWLKHHKKGEGLSGEGNLGKPGRAAMYKAG